MKANRKNFNNWLPPTFTNDRGVLTELNEAFVIDVETRERLIVDDPKSAEIIKPFLAGRDIKR